VKAHYKYISYNTISSKPGKKVAERFLVSLTVAFAEWKWNGFVSNDVTSCRYQNTHSPLLCCPTNIY